ncbi:MAG TPA: ATP phosphoribosyltransferase [Actinomycetota bacterium]|nr:ATP phosphoribosyltransferase [Actinomycetota bacterium]
MLRIVIPKGSLEQATLALFEAADLSVRRTSDRQYHGWIEDPRVAEVSILRPQEIPTYVEEGRFDLGITGQDWVAEREAGVVEVTELHYSKNTPSPIRIVLAVSAESGIDHPGKLPPDLRVSTEYPGLATRYFQRLGIPAKVVLSYGATEAKVPEIVDAIVDNTETGSTLRRHGLKIIDTLMESWTVLVANPKAMEDPAKRQAIQELQILLDGAVRARGKVLVKLNVAGSRLDGVLGLLPSMKAPTVSRLAGGDFYAVETVVEKSQINLLIPELKAKGAEDIIELPLSKIVP